MGIVSDTARTRQEVGTWHKSEEAFMRRKGSPDFIRVNKTSEHMRAFQRSLEAVIVLALSGCLGVKLKLNLDLQLPLRYQYRSIRDAILHVKKAC